MPKTAPTTLTEQAPAKLNLFLGVTPQVEGGKHQLVTVFTTINLADRLTFAFKASPTSGGARPRGAAAPGFAHDEALAAKAGAVTIETRFALGVEAFELPLEHNIIYKTVRAFEQETGKTLEGGLHITLDKRIPAQGGLGGGSSDSAATIRALARYWGIDPTCPPCLKVARQMGSDVLFFLYGGCALMGGSGDVLLRQLPQPALDIVLVKPTVGVSTVEAYREFDANPQPLPAVEPLVAALEKAAEKGQAAIAPEPLTPPPANADRAASGSSLPASLAPALANNLYPAARALLPELEQLLSALQRQAGIARALLTGSGSTVFALCADAATAQAAQAALVQQGYWAQTCTTLSHAGSSSLNSTQLV
ncbi:MAG: hypothetical protein LBU48_03530 [Coriobacteriales bacterium]|nr:hypothetical protein [Coriobacteriales bacterium]